MGRRYRVRTSIPTLLIPGIVVYWVMNSAHSLRTELQLQPHPEGGWYREVYRSAERLQPSSLPERFLGSRSFMTSILFLLEAGEVSHFHRLRSDEVWHFYEGAPMRLHMLLADGSYRQVTLGDHLEKGEERVIAVAHDVWFAAEVGRKKGHTLVGCTVAPGFDFADFELARRADLAAAFPPHHDIIYRLTTP